jgi:hypothetical protein
MLDQIHSGIRGHTLRLVRTVKGDLPRGSRGTVVSKIENLGHHLMLVLQDTGIVVPMFPDEVAFEGVLVRFAPQERVSA